MMEAVRVLQTAPVNTMVVATGLRSSVPAVKKAVNTALIPWNPVPAITCSLRSTIGAPTTISQVLRSTVTVVGPGLRSTVVTSGRSLRSTTKTVGQVPENTVDTAGMDHRSTVISIARDLWNAVVTAGMGLRSTVITVARSLRNVVITDDQGPGNGTAAGIIAGNQGTIMTPTDLLDAGTGGRSSSHEDWGSHRYSPASHRHHEDSPRRDSRHRSYRAPERRHSCFRRRSHRGSPPPQHRRSRSPRQASSFMETLSSSQGYPPSVAANPESPEQSPGTGFPTHLQFGSPSWDHSQLEHRNWRRLCLRWMLFTSSRPHPVSNQITPIWVIT